ncbi:MAG TPA: DUF211 domain-containing protein [Methanocella sp.]|nr:DUF211 domain-containing protein [Methanocella sp.]
MTGIKRLVLDVLKPHKPSILDLARRISKLPDITGVNLGILEVDTETETIKITVEGNDIDFDALESVIEDMGAVIHSVDEVAAGSKLVENVETLQDRY